MPPKKTVPVKKAPRDRPIPVRMDSESLEKLDEVAKANGITRSAVIQIAVKRILKSGI